MYFQKSSVQKCNRLGQKKDNAAEAALSFGNRVQILIIKMRVAEELHDIQGRLGRL